MNAEVRQMRTGAELALAEAFAEARAKLPGAGAIAALRAQAFHDFQAKGLPHRRVEEWKYTDLRAILRDAKPLATPPQPAALEQARGAGRLLAGIDGRRIVLVNGTFAPGLSDLAGLEPGVSIQPLAAALANSDPLVSAHIGKVVATSDVAVSLNTSFMSDGIVLRIGAGVELTRPIQILHFYAGAEPAAVFTRSLVVVEPGARMTLVECHEGPDHVAYQANTALELVVGHKAHVDRITIAADGADAVVISSLLAALGVEARLHDFSFTTGSAVTRNQLFVRLHGDGTNLRLNGAALLRGRQHVDTTMVVDHAALNGVGRELFKSVLDGESRAVFQGKIIVEPGAQKTDGKMMTQALLLSETAEMDAKPELEIFADDVVCGHGATAGALDQDLLFYLKARGIPAKEAEALLIQSFVGEAIEFIEHEGLREALGGETARWLRARSG